MLDAAIGRVADFAHRERMLRRTRRVLVGVSGGPDSVACLLVLLRLRSEFGFEVVVSHFDHKLREGSAHDLQFVRSLAERLGVECLTGEGDVRTVAKERRAGLEDTARKMRYQFLAFVAGKEAADCIATGHTADDQAETVLMRIIRGSGVRGIRGMLPVSPVPGAEAQRLIRPLLELRRSETHAICAEAGIDPLLDASNSDPAFTRNLVRHRTLAALREVNPSVETALVSLAAHAREAFAPIEKQALAVQPGARIELGAIFDLPEFRSLPSEAVTLVLQREAAFYKLEPEVNQTRLENLRSVLERRRGGVRFGEVMIEASQWLVRLGPLLPAALPFPAAILNVPGSTRSGAWRIDVSTDTFEPPDGVNICRVQRSWIEGALRARTLLPGDRILYHGRERKASEIIKALVPRWERPAVVAIADAKHVLALFSPGRTVFEQPRGPDVLHVRLAAVAGGLNA